MPRRTDDFRGLAQTSRMQLMAEVQRTPGLLLRELAERTGLHENTVRDHLVVLEQEGLVTHRTTHPGTRGRPPATYHPVSESGANPEADDRVDRARLHGDLLRRLAPESAPADLDAGGLLQLDALYEHLDDVGLQPELDSESLEIELVPCPYYSLVDRDPDLVCRVHSQLIRDLLTQVPGPLSLTLLEPFTSHDRCRVYLDADAARSN